MLKQQFRPEKTEKDLIAEFNDSANSLRDWRLSHPDADITVNGDKDKAHPLTISAFKNCYLMYEVFDRFFVTDYHYHVDRVAIIPRELFEAIQRKDNAFIEANFPNLYLQPFHADLDTPTA